MKTRDLIQLLAEDGKQPPSPLGRSVALIFLAGVAIIATIFAIFVGLRPDFGEAIGTARVIFKMAIVIALALVGFGLLLQLGRPTARLTSWGWLVAALGAVLVAGAGVELLVVPADRWMTSVNGSNRTLCLVAVPALSVIPLIAAIAALRGSAPRNATWAGAGAGLVAGAVGGTLYALNCNNDSPLFVAAWYPIAIGFVVAAGALTGRYALRW